MSDYDTMVLNYGRPYRDQMVELLKKVATQRVERGETVSLRQMSVVHDDRLGPDSSDLLYKSGVIVRVLLDSDSSRSSELVIEAMHRRVRTVTVESVRIVKRKLPAAQHYGLGQIEMSVAIDSLIFLTVEALHVGLSVLEVVEDDKHWWLSVPAMMPVDVSEADDGGTVSEHPLLGRPAFDVLA